MSTNTSDTEKTITDPTEIRATFAAWAADEDNYPSKLSLVLAPLHDKAWWDGHDDIRDVDGDPLPRAFAVAAGTGGEIPVDISDAEESRVCFYANGPCIALGPQHVRAIKTNSPLVHREIDGLEYALTLLPGEGATVGCQHITRAGCRQVVDIFAAHLALEVRPLATFKANDRVRCVCKAAFADPDEVWVDAMDNVLGREGKVVRPSHSESGVDYLVEFDVINRWYLPAASLEAV